MNTQEQKCMQLFSFSHTIVLYSTFHVYFTGDEIHYRCCQFFWGSHNSRPVSDTHFYWGHILDSTHISLAHCWVHAKMVPSTRCYQWKKSLKLLEPSMRLWEMCHNYQMRAINDESKAWRKRLNLAFKKYWRFVHHPVHTAVFISL